MQPQQQTGDGDHWAVVARRVQVRRARLCKSQSEVEGVTRATVSRLEQGKSISLDALGRIEAALGFAESELIDLAFGVPGTPTRQDQTGS